MSVRKDYRPLIDANFDLCDTTDLDDVISTASNLEALFRMARQNRDEARERRKFLEAIEPWFDPSHPMNAVEDKR